MLLFWEMICSYDRERNYGYQSISRAAAIHMHIIYFQILQFISRDKFCCSYLCSLIKINVYWQFRREDNDILIIAQSMQRILKNIKLFLKKGNNNA